MPDEITSNQEKTDSGVNIDSNAPNTPPETIKAPESVSTPEVVNNTTPENTENKAEMPENNPDTGNTLKNQETKESPKTEEAPKTQESKTAQSETGTAQIPVNEPFENTQDKPLVKISLARELLIKARNMIQTRKRKKLDKVMTMFAKQTKISNDEVEKFLHVSDATAERYLNILEKENKIKQTGKTGHSVFYIKI